MKSWSLRPVLAAVRQVALAQNTRRLRAVAVPPWLQEEQRSFVGARKRISPATGEVLTSQPR